VVLSSQDIQLLEIVADTLEDQFQHSLNVRVTIVVNTRREAYFDEVRDKFGSRFEVVQTESNGYPGKGHNSCIRMFQGRDEDYMFMLDGDDFLYTPALMTAEIAINQFQFDLLGFVPGDSLNSLTVEPETNYKLSAPYKVSIEHRANYKIVIDSDDRLEANAFTEVTQPMHNVFHPDEQLKVETRLLMMSRRAASLIELPLYDEDMMVHDDMATHLFMLAAHERFGFRVTYLWNTNMVLKNACNKGSVTLHANDELRIQVAKADTAVLFSKYLSRYASLWLNGSTSLALKVDQVDDSYIKKTELILHKSVFLEKHARKLHGHAWGFLGYNIRRG
jgi:hypothetical protein